MSAELLSKISYVLMGICMALSAWKDIKTKTISVWVCMVFASAGIVLSIIQTAMSGSFDYIIAAFLGVIPALLIWSVSKLTKGAIGEGDAMLFGVSGLYLGLVWNIVFIWSSCFFSLMVGSVMISLGKLKKKGSLPLGPFALAAWAAMGIGGVII